MEFQQTDTAESQSSSVSPEIPACPLTAPPSSSVPSRICLLSYPLVLSPPFVTYNSSVLLSAHSLSPSTMEENSVLCSALRFPGEGYLGCSQLLAAMN